MIYEIDSSNKKLKKVKEQLVAGYQEIAAVKETNSSESLETQSKLGALSERLGSEYGVKTIDGVPHYQLFYACTNMDCREKRHHRSKLFIPSTLESVRCEACDKEMKVSPAHPEGFPKRDTFGNYFVAGTFKDHNVQW